MTKTKSSVIRALAGLGLLLAASSASANPCVRAAKGEFKDCKAGCVEDFQTAKDACLNRDHRCVEACRDGRAQCIDSTGIKQAFAQCQTALAAAKEKCAGDDSCIDQAQVVAFECRLAARQQYRPEVRACRRGFRACAASCPPGAGPVEDPVTCRASARQNYVTCKAGCVEDFQVSKDACLNRDHACAEDCRSKRATCIAPVAQELARRIAAANDTRDQAIANCKNLYPDGSDDQANCIENARVDAFERRDQAREDAAPGFQDCRAAFRSCVEGCPPASPTS